MLAKGMWEKEKPLMDIFALNEQNDIWPLFVEDYDNEVSKEFYSLQSNALELKDFDSKIMNVFRINKKSTDFWNNKYLNSNEELDNQLNYDNHTDGKSNDETKKSVKILDHLSYWININESQENENENENFKFRCTKDLSCINTESNKAWRIIELNEISESLNSEIQENDEDFIRNCCYSWWNNDCELWKTYPIKFSDISKHSFEGFQRFDNSELLSIWNPNLNLNYKINNYDYKISDFINDDLKISLNQSSSNLKISGFDKPIGISHENMSDHKSLKQINNVYNK